MNLELVALEVVEVAVGGAALDYNVELSFERLRYLLRLLHQTPLNRLQVLHHQPEQYLRITCPFAAVLKYFLKELQHLSTLGYTPEPAKVIFLEDERLIGVGARAEEGEDREKVLGSGGL